MEEPATNALPRPQATTQPGGPAEKGHPHTTPEKAEGGVEEQRTIAIPCDTLERLIARRMKQYERQPSREVKQATDTLKRLLEPEHTDRIAPVA